MLGQAGEAIHYQGVGIGIAFANCLSDRPVAKMLVGSNSSDLLSNFVEWPDEQTLVGRLSAASAYGYARCWANAGKVGLGIVI